MYAVEWDSNRGLYNPKHNPPFLFFDEGVLCFDNDLFEVGIEGSVDVIHNKIMKNYDLSSILSKKL